MTAADTWAARLRTVRAMALLCAARILVATVPFRIWRKGLGRSGTAAAAPDPVAARRFAAQVNRAGSRLPFTTKCLPRAMALSWLLQYAGSPHRLVLAVRPPELRGGDDALHAWIEVDGHIVLGDLPGPWLRLLDQGG